MMMKLLSLLYALAVLARVSFGQEAPFFQTATYDATANHRQDFCPLHRLVTDGNITRRDGLYGYNIHAAVFDYQLTDGIIDPVSPAIGIRIMDELAQRAGFTWRDTYGVVDSPRKDFNETFDTALDWFKTVYDISAEYYMTSAARIQRGVLYPASGWLNADVIMIRRKETAEEFSLWNFAQPFTPGVWMMVLAVVFVSAIVYFLLDYLDAARSGKEMDYSFISTIFVAANTFVGHIEFSPKSISTRLVVFSSAFSFCLFLSAYTANLASFLVVQNKGGLVINELADAIQNDLRICMWAGTGVESFFRRRYPTYSRTLTYDGWGAEVVAVQNGECDIGLIVQDDFLTFQQNVNYNPDCAVEWVGRVANPAEAGYVLGDNVDYCGSVVRDILDIHMLDMINEGKLSEIWDAYRSEIATIDCTDSETETVPKGRVSLNIKNMAGIIVFHGSLLVVALLFSLAKLCNSPRSKKLRGGKVSPTLPSFQDDENRSRKGTESGSDAEELKDQVKILIEMLQDNNNTNSTALTARTPPMAYVGSPSSSSEFRGLEDRIAAQSSQFEEKMSGMEKRIMKQIEEQMVSKMSALEEKINNLNDDLIIYN